jgi:DNA-directed RNA polymerase subunit RPC12/RpoP
VPPQLPREQGDDGLVSINCPYCRWRWYRVQPGNANLVHEIKCIRCKRIVVFKVRGKWVEDLTAQQQ